MSLCKGCGAAIGWINTITGKAMPVDQSPVWVVPEPGPRAHTYITDEGTVIYGRPAREDEVADATVAYVPHWATCPSAGQFRRK